MKRIIAGHSCHAFLKPGEVIISGNPIVVSTVLGSCVAVTLYSKSKRVGSICHAMLPNNLKNEGNLLYVDTAVHYLHRKMSEYGAGTDLIVKLFGGAQVMPGGQSSDSQQSVGEQNIARAKMALEQLGLRISKEDIGGRWGRKILFSIKTGDVYLRRLISSGNEYVPEERAWPKSKC